MTTAELIEKLERAEGPSRELFEAAWLVIHHDGYSPENERDTCRLCQRFYRMLDAAAWESAALTLVPEGPRRIEFGTYEQGGNCWAYVHTPNDTLGEADDAATEALALCIAALKAKYEAAAEKADHDYRIALADADRRTDDFIRNNRLRKTGGSGASVANASAEGEAAGSGNGAGEGAVLVSADDVRICTANSVRLQAVREWGLELVKAGVAQ